MPRPKKTDQTRRDQQVNAMVTKPEKAAVLKVAAELGMSASNAARYLMHRGLSAHHGTDFVPEEGEPS